ncbi:MAG: hypothetical protein R3D67_05725 [Hyphomicrobiaceae bacterium]
MYRTLDIEKIVDTIMALERRISERFEGAGLARVCGELAQIARENKSRLERNARPNLILRSASATLILAGVAALAYVASLIKLKANTEDLFGVLQGIEASVNLLLVMGAGVFSLVTLEGRWKRRRALDDLHELRSIVHVIDMHQLTKDPSTNSSITPPTASSPTRRLNPAELVRYLDYCSEMLSLTAKVAALYAQNSSDATVIDGVNDIERLTTNLSAKIWQKITIVQAMVAAGPVTSVPVIPPLNIQASQAGADGKELREQHEIRETRET